MTGGTIGGCVPEYPDVGRLSGIFQDTSSVDRYITKSLKVAADYEIQEICKKDSREVTDEDRASIVREIVDSYGRGVRHFLITHGTYTMPDTGVYLMKHLDKDLLSESNIIITGSMYPLNFIGSDGLMNIGASISSLLNAQEPLGVKICMHAKNWDPEKVRKDAENLIFEELE